MEFIRKITRIMEIVAGAVLVMMMLLTVADVLMRYFLSRPIIGATEFTEGMMVCIAFLGLAWCAVEQSHLNLDLLVSGLPEKGQRLIDSVTLILGLIVVALIAWRISMEGLEIRQLNVRVSPLSLNLPAYPLYFIAAFGAIMLCPIMLAQIIENIVKVVKK